MNKKSPDRRIGKTKRAIYKALLELLEDYELSRITVTELTQRADINRKTFYNHYTDIADVIDEMEDIWVAHLGDILNEALSPYSNFQDLNYDKIREHTVEIAIPFFKTTISELKDNPAYFKILEITDGHTNLLRKIVASEKELILNTFGSNIANNKWLDFLLIFSINGAMAMIFEWYQSDFSVAVDELANFFQILFTSDQAFDYIQKMS